MEKTNSVRLRHCIKKERRRLKGKRKALSDNKIPELVIRNIQSIQKTRSEKSVSGKKTHLGRGTGSLREKNEDTRY